MTSVETTAAPDRAQAGTVHRARDRWFPRIHAPAIAAPLLNRANGPEPSTAATGISAAPQSLPAAVDSGVRPPELAAPEFRRIAHAAVPPSPRPLDLTPRSRFVLEQEWLGRVEAVSDNSFTAVLLDATGRTDEEEVADISRVLVNDDDETLVVPGALFYWVIGFRIDARVRRGESRLIFRRSLPWTATERSAAEAEALRLADQLAANRQS